MNRWTVVLASLLLQAISCAAGAGADDDKVVLEAGGAMINLHRPTASIQNLRVGPGLATMARGPLSGYVEVVDLRDRRTYGPLTGAGSVTGWKVAGGDKATGVSFTQQHKGAPFRIDHELRATPAGVRWDVSVVLHRGQKQDRSVLVCWVLPAPRRWQFWVARDTAADRVSQLASQRYTYGHGGFGARTTIIPLAGLWGRRGGLVCWSPPDIQKTQIAFQIDSRDLPDPAWGMTARPEERPRLRIAYQLVGLRPGKPLKLAVCLAGVRSGWRPALGHYVQTYPELFEPAPATRKVEGMYGITGLGTMTDKTLREMVEAGVTFVELHGSFYEYSNYVTEEMLADPDKRVTCKPHPNHTISLNHNRRWIDRIKKAGIAPFIYYYNCHALPATIEKLWPGAAFQDERGRPLLKWYTEPSVYGPPGSPYAKHLIRQMEVMLKAYPKLPGFFIDNFGIEMVSFAHDDGVTMIHDRPAYDLNRNHQGIGPAVFEKAHKAGRLIMINKLATIESARGADMVLTEGMSLHSVRAHALACVYRPVFPLGMRMGGGPGHVERCLKQLLLVGGTPEWGFYKADPDTMKAYRPLTDAMIGKRWVLDEPDPLTLPAGHEGQIFRIDEEVSKRVPSRLEAPHAAHGGDVVVALVNPNVSWKQSRLTENLTVKVRLPEAAKLTQATWLSVERSAGKPLPCKFALNGSELTIQLPPAGAAGILRLSR